MTAYDLVSLVLSHVILGACIGGYGGQSFLALVTLRALPRRIELGRLPGLPEGEYQAVLDPRFIRRVRIYALAGMGGMCWILGSAITSIVSAFL